MLQRIDEVADLMQALENVPQGNPLKDNPAYQAVAKRGYVRVPRIISITRPEQIGGFDGSDFSPEMIKERADEGYARPIRRWQRSTPSRPLSSRHLGRDGKIVLDVLYERRSHLIQARLWPRLSRSCGNIGAKKYLAIIATNWTIEAFAKTGARYEQSELDRSAIYMNTLPIFTSGFCVRQRSSGRSPPLEELLSQRVRFQA
jgi:hypothetical protein